MTNNLKVDEEYIRQVTSTEIKKLQQMDDYINQYIGILQFLSSKAIQSGKTASKLNSFINIASQLQGVLKVMGNRISIIQKNYLLEIDQADEFLF